VAVVGLAAEAENRQAEIFVDLPYLGEDGAVRSDAQLAAYSPLIHPSA
jgi:hypothetical protein